MTCCKVKWCVALAAPNSGYCAPHAKRSSSHDCGACQGTGKCEDCDGAFKNSTLTEDERAYLRWVFERPLDEQGHPNKDGPSW